MSKLSFTSTLLFLIVEIMEMTNQIAIEESPNLENKSHTRKKTFITSILGILCALTLFGIGSFLGMFYIDHQNNTNKTLNNSAKLTTTPKVSMTPTSSITKHGSETISLDSTYNKYLNYDLGISITFSKTVADTASCSGTAPQVQAKEASVPVKVYPDTANNQIYIAAEQYATTVDHQISPGVYQGMDSCVVNNTTLDAIKNASDNLNKHDWVESMLFTYGKVLNVNELADFAKNLVPTGMVIDSMTSPTQTGNNYSYKFKRTVTPEGDPANPGWYYLIYNPVKQLALFWVTPNTQSVGWADVDTNGSYINLEAPYASILDQ